MSADRNTWPYEERPSLWRRLFGGRRNVVELGTPPKVIAKREQAASRQAPDPVFRPAPVETGADVETAPRPETAPRRRTGRKRKSLVGLFLQSLARTFQPTGRASRREFWAFVLVGFLFFMFGSGLFAAFFSVFPSEDAAVIATLIWLGLLVSFFSLTMRRMHDSGRRAWWIIFSVTNPISFLLLLYRLLQPGDPGANEFGFPPED